MIYLHSVEAVWELLKKGKIKVKWLVREYIDDNGQLRREFTEPMDYESWKKLDDKSRLNIKICDTDGRNCSKFSSLFPETWSKEDIAKAFEKAEELLKTRNNWKLLWKLTEEDFIEYCKLWWVYDPDSDKYKNLLKRFRNWWEIKFSEFWSDFNKNVFEYNWIEIKIWWKYVNGELIMEVSTIFPSK